MSKYDLVIKNGLVVDGTGAPPFKVDIGISEDKIVKLGDIDRKDSEYVIDADGLIVSPGFIDVHNHSDISIFMFPRAENYVYQGVTTVVVGNCGFSPSPYTDDNKEYIDKFVRFLQGDFQIKWNTFSEYLDMLSELKKSINIATLIGQGTVRGAVIGLDDKQPTDREVKKMKELVMEAMKSGALGLSTGLLYIPGAFTSTDEIIELAKVASRYHGIYTSHIRNEGIKLVDSVLEAIKIGLEANIPVEISHLKAAGKLNWGKVSVVLDIIAEYAERGYEIGADAYPYTASSTSLISIFPSWVREGDDKSILRRLNDGETMEKIRFELENKGLIPGRSIDWENITISSSLSHQEVEGLTLNEISNKWDLDPLTTVLKLLMDDELTTGMIVHGMSEKDVELVISNPYVCIGSDGSIKKLHEKKPHPRNYGAFPRILRKYVKELKVLSLSEAVRKMTGLPATRFKLWDRGIIRPGMKADIVIFNFNRVSDMATYQDPHKYPIGIDHVIINGKIVVVRGEHTNIFSGKLIRHKFN